MRIAEYDGYFENGLFYMSGKAVPLPEKRRVVIQVFNDAPNPKAKKQPPARSKLRLDFVDAVPSLPDSFFDPLPEEELKLWEE